MRHLAGIEHHRAANPGGQPGQVGRPGAHVVVDDGPEDLHSLGVIVGQLCQRPTKLDAEVLEGEVALVGLDAVARDIDVLRGRAHLAGVERERERQVAHHSSQVVGRVHDDRVHAGLLGVDELPCRGTLTLEPATERGTAGVVDDRDLGPGGQCLGQSLTVGLWSQLHQSRIETIVPQHFSGDLNADGKWQDGPRMRLDDDRVPGGQ